MRGGVKEKGIKGLAWTSYGFAAVAGAATAGTFIGDWMSAALGIFPGWVGALLFVGALVAMGIDLFVDGIPNQIALYVAMSLPTLARTVPGKLGDTVTDLAHQLIDRVGDLIGLWLGVSSAIGVAAVAATVSLLMARRVVAKGR